MLHYCADIARSGRALLLLVCLSFSAYADQTLTAAPVLIGADHSHIQYTGRIDFSDPAAPLFTWPGTAVTVVFTGTSAAVKLHDQYGKNFYNAVIDEAWDKPIILQLKEGEHTYPVATGLSDGEHRLTLFKRTEGEEGATYFKGLVLERAQGLLAPPARPERRIAFFGDSITSGMGNEAPEAGDDDDLADKNHFLSYAAITARALNAEHHTISQSGIGIMVSWFDFTMPQFYDQLSAVGNNDSQWDFSQWTPEVVVINLFQNDSWLVDKRLDPVPTEAQRIQAYVDFLTSVRRHYPHAFIVCTLGSMDATKAGSPWPGYIAAAVERIKTEQQDQRIDTLFFPFKEFYKHPRVHHHQENAALLTQFIREKMHW
jgi:hypothetical protein